MNVLAKPQVLILLTEIGTALECSNDPDIKGSTWMGRSVIRVDMQS